MASILEQLEKMLGFFQNRNEHEIRGASIFMVMCLKSKYYSAKLIDLNSVVPLTQTPDYDGESRDAGFTMGIQKLIEYVSELR